MSQHPLLQVFRLVFIFSLMVLLLTGWSATTSAAGPAISHSSGITEDSVMALEQEMAD